MNLLSLKEKNGGFEMDSFIVDTVAFLAYLADNLPEKADQIFRKAERKKVKLLLPSIALGETLSTIYKGKDIFGKSISLEKVDLIFNILQNKKTLELIDLSLEAWRIFHGLEIPELHDRMIASTFHSLNAKGLITNDPEISKKVNSIWK
jgi:predicted nucleic acid-binding protein